MRHEETMKAKGHITFKLFGPDGSLKDTREIDNLIVTVGKNFLANWLAQSSQADYFMRYISLGTGTTAAQSSDTGLQTEVATRVAGTISSNTNIWSNNVTFPAGNGTGAITEAGLFSAVTAGTMFARQVFAVINKGVGDTLEVTWQVTFS